MRHHIFFTSVFASAICMFGFAAIAQTTTNAVTTTNTHYKPMPRIAVKDVDKDRRVWEGISPNAENNKGSHFQIFNDKVPLINVLIKGVNEGKIKAYADGVPTYTKTLTTEEFAEATKNLSANKNIKYVVKEDSLVLKTGEVMSFMLGLSVVIPVTAADGSVSDKTLFCLFYPDCRSYLAEVPVMNDDTWYDVFEQHAYAFKVEQVKHM